MSAYSFSPLQREGVNKKVPYVSEAQRGYFHANRKKLEKQGVNVSEWDKASKGAELPKKKSAGARLMLLHKEK